MDELSSLCLWGVGSGRWGEIMTFAIIMNSMVDTGIVSLILQVLTESLCVGVCVCVCVRVWVPQLCLTLCDPRDCHSPFSSVQGILQARILGWIAIPFSKGSSRSRDGTWVSCIAGRFFIVWATSEAQFSLTGALTRKKREKPKKEEMTIREMHL